MYCIVIRGRMRYGQLTCAENFVKFLHVLYEIHEQTDSQTNRQPDIDMVITILCIPTGGKVRINVLCHMHKLES